MHAQTLNCPMCGAAASTDATRCLFCDARLATASCPSCFGMMFLGDRHCPRCGASASREEIAAEAASSCPRCREEMASVAIGGARIGECARCGGLWVSAEDFEKICADREQQSAILIAASPTRAEQHARPEQSKVRYVPCPRCGQLMNRVNFAHCSGVVVDICKGHGTWFDRDELSQIVEFIRKGGLDAARAREKQQLAEERRLLRQEQLANATKGGSAMLINERESQAGGLLSASELLKLLLD
jgi:Zn-finger nucleic acid-binding protein